MPVLSRRILDVTFAVSSFSNHDSGTRYPPLGCRWRSVARVSTRNPRIAASIPAVMPRPSQSVVRALAALRTLATQKGYEVERAMMRDCYGLIGADKVPARHADRSTGFLLKEATAFLERQPDVLPQ
jgi:hypothetical protein